MKAGDDGGVFYREGQLTTVPFEVTSDDEAFLYLTCRTTSWELDGERTDAHDIFSILLAAFLRRSTTNYSISLWDVANPAADIETEIYARALTLDQPDKSLVRTSPESLTAVKKLLSDVALFELFFPRAFERQRGTAHGFSWDDDATRAWANDVASALREQVDEKVQFNRRWGPDWLYYRSIRRHVSVVQSATAAVFVTSLGTSPSGDAADREIRGVNGALFVSPRVRSAVPLRTIAFARRVLKQLHAGTLPPVSTVPLENHVLFAAGSYLVVVRRDCGLQTFKDDVQRVGERHRHEARILFSAVRFEWAGSIDDERFELLIRHLLTREAGVQRVRKAGHSRDADRSCDLLVDWLTPPAPGSSVPEHVAPNVLRRVIVQVKASARSVNKAKVQDIRDTIEDHQAQGYFLAVSSQLTSDLTAHLERLRSQGPYWADWWNRSEIEERLNTNPDIADRFSDIVRRIS